jgi:hypothetical protein
MYCTGIRISTSDTSLIIQSQDNFRNLLNNENESKEYCKILEEIKNGSNTSVKLEGLLGFFLPRVRKSDNSTLFPTAFYHCSNDGKNEFLLQSYKCVEKKNILDISKVICEDCSAFWRSFRNNNSIKHLKVIEHNRILRSKEKKYDAMQKEFTEYRNLDKIKWTTYNKKYNKLIKRASYWRKKCKTLEEAVRLWREIELDREGMLEIGDDEALIWENFYKFIDDLIDKEHFSSPEKRALHKELIRAETNTLGKYNKRQDKRGIRNTKISSRVLNYSLTLANNLGKVKYEIEASLRSLPSWSTLTRYALYILFIRTNSLNEIFSNLLSLPLKTCII